MSAIFVAFQDWCVPGFDQCLTVPLPDLTLNHDIDKARPFLTRPLTEIATKWILNVLSTGAHVHKGKVYHNYMVDVRVR